MHKLHNLKKMLLESLDEFADKGVSNSTDLKTVDMMAHAAKNLGKVIEMCEEEDSGSSFRRGGSYRMSNRVYDGDGSSSYEYGDSSYRRRRDSMGRYSRADRGYAEAAEDMKGRLEEMLQEARSEEERKTIRKMMESI